MSKRITEEYIRNKENPHIRIHKVFYTEARYKNLKSWDREIYAICRDRWSLSLKNNYINKKEALKQNVVTRIKSCKNDWFLDSEANIGWWDILGIKQNEGIIKNQVYNTVVATYGVISIKNIDIQVDTATRKANIKIDLKTIYDDVSLEVGV